MKINRRKVGLALGSGGPKGLAHIGVIKILEENNIPIDFIAGSSMGALIGGFYAANKDIKDIEKTALRTDWKLVLSLLDPSFKKGLLVGQRVKEFLESYIGKMQFENLKIPLSVVSTNIVNGESFVSNSGDVASAIRASISMPIVFKPINRGDKLLADGGLSMPVPVEVVKNMGADFIIAVNLDSDYFSGNNYKTTKFGYYKVAQNSINLLRHHLSYCNVKNADVVLNPKVGITHWGKLLDGKDLILAGEESARGIITQLN